MATTFYLTAGLTAQDSAAAIVGDHVFYMTAGLPANDYVAAASVVGTRFMSNDIFPTVQLFKGSNL
jgi:hypothetical protein